ncbi:HTH domain-containing protein [Chitinophaga lutea]
MKWIDAIKKVLQEEERSLHYEEIAELILKKGYREKVGATPAATVVSIITSDINKNGPNSAFIRVGIGEYFLKQSTPQVTSSYISLTEEEEVEEQQEIELATDEFSEKGLIKTFGMFWSRTSVLWKNNPNLLGVEQRGAVPVNFAGQIGLYLLHDGREVIYIGQAVDQSISQRLYQHTSDRLGGRWDRFSWFGFKGVRLDGTLTEVNQNVAVQFNELIDTMEAILVEALEPRQNRKRGNSFYGLEFIQEKDPEINKQDMVSLLDSMKSKLTKGG